MKRLPAIFIAIILLATFFLNSCEGESCPPNALAYAKFTLVNQHGKAVAPTVPASIIGQMTADITVYDTLDNGQIVERIVEDSIISDTLINKESNMSTFKVPLSYSNETTLIIDLNGEQQDYITIKHNNIPYFMSVDCGTMMFHEATEVTHSYGIDSIEIINPNIDNYEKENFRIYYTVADTQ